MVIVWAEVEAVGAFGDTLEITGHAFTGAITLKVIVPEGFPVSGITRADHVAGLDVKFALIVISVPAELMDTGIFS
jgi:hypothetical protein